MTQKQTQDTKGRYSQRWLDIKALPTLPEQLDAFAHQLRNGATCIGREPAQLLEKAAHTLRKLGAQ